MSFYTYPLTSIKCIYKLENMSYLVLMSFDFNSVYLYFPLPFVFFISLGIPIYHFFHYYTLFHTVL